jgi:hypothetical protein
MSKRISWIFALSHAAGLAGCATQPIVTSQTVVIAGVGPVEIERLNVRVVDIDRANRTVVVEQRGRRWLVEVPPLFGDLQTVRVGDNVEIRRVEGVLVDVGRKRRGSKPGITYTQATSGPFQNLPDKYVLHGVTITARFEQFDATNNVVSYVGPFGPRSITVVDPAVQAELKTFRRGDMVDLSFVEAFHIILS